MTMQSYYKWVDDNIKSKKSADEMYTAINWMERNAAVVVPMLDNLITHPAFQFNRVIEIITDGIKDNKDYRLLIIDWLVEDGKVPFGKILKTKALRKLKKYFIRLDELELVKLKALFRKLDSLEYKPTEYKWLAKIMERCV